jgi:phosphorylcholine metabolism protein LicD
MPEYYYKMDGIMHEINSSNEFPPSVKFVNDEKKEIYVSPKQQQICRNLKKILLEWKRIADQLDIKWFVNGGTLLGTLRDKGLIFYDNDIDIVVQMKDHHKLINYECADGFVLTESEAGFNLSRSKLKFPFMDIWVIGPDKHNNEKMTICGPVINGESLYYFNKVWPNEWYYKKELKRLETALFEDIPVFIPTNAEQIVKRMYGPTFLREYRIESHTEDHALAAVPIFDVENRVKIAKGWAKLNRALHLDQTKNNDGHLTCLIAKTIAELTVVSSSNKHARIHKHVLDFLKAQLDYTVQREK